MNPEIEKWQSRYQAIDEVIEPKAEPELIRNQRYLDGTGKAAELASGKGANALYLASLGYEVTAIDCAERVLENTEISARYHGLTINTEAINLRDPWNPKSQFSLISMIRFLDRDLLTALPEHLVPGGLLFINTFNQNWLKKKPGFNTDYVLQLGELTEMYSALECIDSNEEATHIDSNLNSSYFLGRKT